MGLHRLFKKKSKHEDYDAPTLRDEAERASRSSPHGDLHDESNWLISYADLMTLLCGFFIMLFSLSSLDAPQYEKVKEAVAAQFGGSYESPHKELAQFVTQVIHEAGVEKEASVRVDPSGVAVVFESTLFFDTLSADLRAEGERVLNALITRVGEKQTESKIGYKIIVEGHTDGRPILSGTFPTNWELSSARASRVVRMFIDRGFTPKLLSAIGYADTRPEASDRSPSGQWDDAALAKNRRVIIRIESPKT